MHTIKLNLRNLFQWSVCALVLMGTVVNSSALNVDENVPLDNSTGEMPARLVPLPPEQTRIHEGFLDVTKAPYYADNTGASDAHAAIQNAIDDAYLCNLVVFFPSGTYLCSDSLHCIQSGIAGKLSQFRFSHKMLGSTEGPRPVLKLMDHSVLTPYLPGAGSVFVSMVYLLKSKNSKPPREMETVSYCGVFRGINIDMGNNPNNSALRVRVAQHGAIEDVHIYGTAFDHGITGTPGGGGSSANIKVTGGRIGVKTGRDVPTIEGLTLENQSLYGLELGGVGATVISGFSIKGPAVPAPEYRAVYARNLSGGPLSSAENMVLTDGTIEVAGRAAIAIHNYNQDVYLQNVYVKAANIIESGHRNSPADVLAGDANGWLNVRRYVFRSKKDGAAIMINGVDYAGSSGDYQYYDPLLPVSAPPSNLISRHVWDEATFPSWEDPGRVSITDFGAIPDYKSGSAYDNAPAIQAALNYTTTVGSPSYGKPVFIPRGTFNISSPIMVPAGGKLIGASQSISQLNASVNWKPTAPTSMLTTVDDPTAEAIFFDFAIKGNQPSVPYPGTGAPDTSSQRFLRQVTIQSGKTIWRQMGQGKARHSGQRHEDEPLMLITNNGGGNFYNLINPGSGSQDWAPNQPSAAYTRLLVSGTTLPVRFYHLNYGKLDWNGVGKFENAHDVSIYAWKAESINNDSWHGLRLMNATNVAHFSFFGFEGKFAITDLEGLAVVNGKCEDVRMAQFGHRAYELLAYQGPAWLTDTATGDTIPDSPTMCLFAKDAAQLRLYAGDSIDNPELFIGSKMDFGRVRSRSKSSQKTFTINNAGFADLTNLAVTVDGVGRGDFKVSELDTTTLSPGATTTFTINFTPSAGGRRNATAHIKSNDPGAAFDINLEARGGKIGKRRPVFSRNSIYSPNAMEDAVYKGSIKGYASDLNGDKMTYSKVSGPSWLSVSADGTLSGTPGISDVGKNTFNVEVRAKDGRDRAKLTISVDFINDAPSFSGPVTLSAGKNNVAYMATVAGSATDPDSGDTLTYSLVETSSWFFMYPDGTIGGHPDDRAIGAHTYTLKVRDQNGKTDTTELNITVLDVNGVPAFTADPVNCVNAIQDVPYWDNLTQYATDTDSGDTLTFSETSGPAWLTVASDGTLSGTPGLGDVGLNTWAAQVSDGQGGKHTVTLNITVDSYPAVTSLSLPILDAAIVNYGSRGTPKAVGDILSTRNGNSFTIKRTDVSMIKVDTSSMINGTAVSAKLTLHNALNSRDRTLYIYGVDDSASFQDWTGGTNGNATWNSVTTNGLFQPVINLYHGQKNMTFIDSQWLKRDNKNDYPVWTYNQAMIDFLNADTDGLVTFVLCTEMDKPAGIRSHTHANAPTLEVTFKEGRAPVFVTDPIYTIGGAVGAAYTGTIYGSATDVNVGDVLTYSKVSGPSWLNVAADGTLSGTPLSADAGFNNWTVRVSDDTGLTDTASLRFDVSPFNATPPTVSFGDPSDAQVFSEGITNLYVLANASDNGSIKNLKLYVNGQSVRREGAAPYEWGDAGKNDPLLQNLANGVHLLQVIATDNEGATAVDSITIRVGEEE